MRVYIGLQNFWPDDANFRDLQFEGKYRIDKNCLTLSQSAPQGPTILSNGKVATVYKHLKVTSNTSIGEIISKYPECTDWLTTVSWPPAVGRYDYVSKELGIYLCIDVCFGLSRNDNSLYTSRVPNEWTSSELDEWLQGEKGYWNRWTYGLNNASVADVIMETLSKIPPMERTVERVVRHFTIYSNQSVDGGILFGSWDLKNMKDGKHPSHWNTTAHILNHRKQSGDPSKYAQCWNFAEVLTSIFRYLNIPSRTIYANNARIDRGEDGGIDLEVTPKKGDSGETVYDENDEYKPDIKSFAKVLGNFEVPSYSGVKTFNDKGQEGDDYFEFRDFEPGEILSKGDGCEEIDLHELVKKGDSMWNFHLWTEIYMNGSGGKTGWFCVDGSPVRQTKIKDVYSEYKGSGPVFVEDLLNGKHSSGDFQYFNSTVNAVFRYWRTQDFKLPDGDTITCTFPYSINYGSINEPQTRKSLRVYTRDPHANGTATVRKSLNDLYKPDRKVAFEHYHRGHPICVAWKIKPTKREGGVLRFVVNRLIKGPHLIQLCYIEKKVESNSITTTTCYSLIVCNRQICEDIRNYVPPPTPPHATSVSLLVADLTSGQWWTSVI